MKYEFTRKDIDFYSEGTRCSAWLYLPQTDKKCPIIVMAHGLGGTQGLWIWGVVIAIIKIGNIIRGHVFKKQFVSLHTIMNKITGLLLFLLPLTMFFIELKYSSIVVCSLATFAAIQEGFCIRTESEPVSLR